MSDMSEQAVNEEMLTTADKIRLGLLDTRELLFIQSQANIIEKTLGDSETMLVRPECLVAFQNTITLKR